MAKHSQPQNTWKFQKSLNVGRMQEPRLLFAGGCKQRGKYCVFRSSIERYSRVYTASSYGNTFLYKRAWLNFKLIHFLLWNCCVRRIMHFPCLLLLCYLNFRHRQKEMSHLDAWIKSLETCRLQNCTDSQDSAKKKTPAAPPLGKTPLFTQ